MSNTEEKKLYSSHIFMFPFRFDYAKKGIVDKKEKKLSEYEFYYDNDIKKRIDLEKLDARLTADKSEWKYKKHKDYNSFAYFYDYARNAMFNLNNEFHKHDISATYNRDDFNGKKYIIDVKKKSTKEDGKDTNKIEANTYTLTIEDVSLQIFQTGVGILSIKLNNYEMFKKEDGDNKEDIDHILRINDYGRRIYPAFLGKDGNLEKPKENFLANSITIESDGNKIADEDFIKPIQNDLDISIGEHVMKLLGDDIFTDKKNDANKYYIQPSLDDRMFVMCWYGDGSGNFISQLSSDDDIYMETSKSEWYRYLFVDNGKTPTINYNAMKDELLKEATYKRWIDKKGTIWGITRYSFMAITEPYSNLVAKDAEFVVEHLKSHYFIMANMLLANRTSILRFSDEIASLVAGTDDYAKDAVKTEELYKQYLDYYNRLFFKEVTHQDQGIEMYDLGMKQMKIDKHITKLDNKFTKLFEFNNLKAEQIEQNKKDEFNNMLSLFGTLFILPSLIIGLLSVDILKPSHSLSIVWSIFTPLVFSILSGWALIQKKIPKIFGFIFLLFAVGIILFNANLKPNIFVLQSHNTKAVQKSMVNKLPLKVKEESNATK